MSGPFVAVIAAIAAASTVLLTLVRRRVPDEGLLRWLWESFRSVRHRQSDATETAASAAVAGQRARVADLLDMGEDGPAYHQAPDLIEMVGRRRSSR